MSAVEPVGGDGEITAPHQQFRRGQKLGPAGVESKKMDQRCSPSEPRPLRPGGGAQRVAPGREVGLREGRKLLGVENSCMRKCSQNRARRKTKM